MSGRRGPDFRGSLVLLAALFAAPTASSRGEDAAVDLVGTPASVEISPASPVLAGRRANARLIVTATYPDGNVRDLTRALEWSSADPNVAVVSPTGLATPKADGTVVLTARKGSVEVSTTVKVEGMANPAPVSFRRDVVPALSQASCNMGACHGTPTGKGGLKLSLRGYLPDQDFLTLSRESGGRRINTLNADASVILRKPLGESPHEGGIRLKRDSKAFEYIRDWIAEGAHDDPAAVEAVKLEILPGARVLNAPAKTQQLVVMLTLADGTRKDVSSICYYDSSSPDVAEVDSTGYVTFKNRGEVAIIAHFLSLVANVRLTHLVDVPGFTAVDVPQDNPVDRAVYTKLNRMRIAPSEACSDAEFIRRAYLDVIGALPRPEEVDAFLKDSPADRRAKVIDALLERPEFYDFWALKFADVLRSNGRLIEPKGAYVFHRWIRSALESGMPMDQFVRNLLASDGSTFSNPATNYYRISRDPETSTETTAQLFLGVRIQCAKCHNHPFERWTQDDYYGFAAFFSQVGRKPGALPGEEVVYATGGGEVKQPRTGKVMPPKALGGPKLEDAAVDRRARLASWLTSKENPFFGKSLVNRVWYHLMGRGIVEPVDDFRDSNPASNDELLDGLTRDFVAGGYNLKSLIRTVLQSRTYQLSATTNKLNVDDAVYFSHATTKLLPAEVLLDAICDVTGSPNAFAGLPAAAHAIQLPDGKMDDPFLKTFGRPARELACECERESDSNLSQALQLIGGATVNNKLRSDAGRIAGLAKSGKPPEAITEDLYMIAFSRTPTPAEMEAAVKHLKGAKDLRPAVEDLAWVLINSKEFLFRH
ncbi:DUF1549 domain-containing protein [Paludisphaera mucosa]|uniref:DUF1553 domain-containing protein n=1 Tax=Paludisphaera mucosa TaxID=3030827 RepID=A0ABT6F732_9BACT|nr:DUF1549 domain-containing protein [Paludisphaera mucosa]MDG3003296.1 DUF1553 domain-containing protein [Paludisphaera mucosa]